MDSARTIGEVPGSSGSVNSRRLAGDRLNGVRVKCSAKIFVMAVPIVTLAQASRSYISRMLRDGVLMLLVGVWLGTVAAHAQDATWVLHRVQATGTPPLIGSPALQCRRERPHSVRRIRRLSRSQSAPRSISSSSTPERQPIPLISQALLLTINGTGIVNNSSNAPTIINNSGGGTLFLDTSTAGNATIINKDSAWFTEFSIEHRRQCYHHRDWQRNRVPRFSATRATAGNATVITNSGVHGV